MTVKALECAHALACEVVDRENELARTANKEREIKESNLLNTRQRIADLKRQLEGLLSCEDQIVKWLGDHPISPLKTKPAAPDRSVITKKILDLPHDTAQLVFVVDDGKISDGKLL